MREHKATKGAKVSDLSKRSITAKNARNAAGDLSNRSITAKGYIYINVSIYTRIYILMHRYVSIYARIYINDILSGAICRGKEGFGG